MNQTEISKLNLLSCFSVPGVQTGHRLAKMMKEKGLTPCSKTQVYRVLNDLVKDGQLEKTEGGYRRLQPSFGALLTDEKLKDCEIIAYAPFAPIIAGAHTVLSGASCLIFPLNAYVGIGLKKIKPTGGVIECNFPEAIHGKAQGLTTEKIQHIADYAYNVIAKSAGYNRLHMPSLRMLVYSHLDVNQGCGGSGALAVASTLSLMTALGLLKEQGPFNQEQSCFSNIFFNAFKIEQFIHGSGLADETGPFSSGGSVFGSVIGSSDSRLYQYSINNIADLKSSRDVCPKYKIKSVTSKIPQNSMFLVLGSWKSTAHCIGHVLSVKKGIDPKVFQGILDLWANVVEQLAKEFKKKENVAAPSQAISSLLTIQHGIYTSLGLSDSAFSQLVEYISCKYGMGGSIIGGGLGGTCLLFASKECKITDFDLRYLAPYNSGLQFLENVYLEPSAGARVIRNNMG